MSRMWALLKILLINYFGVSASQVKDKRNRTAYLKKIGLGTIIITSLAPAVWLYSKILIQGFDLLAPIGQEGAILT